MRTIRTQVGRNWEEREANAETPSSSGRWGLDSFIVLVVSWIRSYLEFKTFPEFQEGQLATRMTQELLLPVLSENN